MEVKGNLLLKMEKMNKHRKNHILATIIRVYLPIIYFYRLKTMVHVSDCVESGNQDETRHRVTVRTNRGQPATVHTVLTKHCPRAPLTGPSHFIKYSSPKFK